MGWQFETGRAEVARLVIRQPRRVVAQAPAAGDRFGREVEHHFFQQLRQASVLLKGPIEFVGKRLAETVVDAAVCRVGARLGQVKVFPLERNIFFPVPVVWTTQDTNSIQPRIQFKSHSTRIQSNPNSNSTRNAIQIGIQLKFNPIRIQIQSNPNSIQSNPNPNSIKSELKFNPIGIQFNPEFNSAQIQSNPNSNSIQSEFNSNGNSTQIQSWNLFQLSRFNLIQSK